MKLNVRAGGTVTGLELRRTDGGFRFRLGEADERTALVDQVEPGVYSVLIEGRSYEARVEPNGGDLIVVIGGHRFELAVEDPRRWSPVAAARGMEGRQHITTPMPGKVVRLLVAVGDAVAAGQGMLVVEAMKMQNEMRAPKPGRVLSIAAREGATVTAGEILATIE